MQLPDSARALVEAGALGHLVTINPDGTPPVTGVRVAVSGYVLHISIDRVGGSGPWT